MVARGEETGENWGVTANWYRVFFVGNKSVLKLDSSILFCFCKRGTIIISILEMMNQEKECLSKLFT